MIIPRTAFAASTQGSARTLLCALTLALFWLLPPMGSQAAAPKTELVMFELGTCIYCAVWNDAVGRGYGATDTGGRAPLRRVDLRKQRPGDLRHLTGVRMTPTFVLLHDGQEVGRILGYIDAPTFWRQLEALMWQVPARLDDAALTRPARATE